MAKNNPAIKYVIITIVIVLIILGAITYTQYKEIEKIKELDIKLEKVTIKETKLTSITLDSTIKMYNPNKQPVTIGELNAELGANRVPLTQIKMPATRIEGMQEILTIIPVKISYLDVGMAILTAIQEKEATWYINGTYTLEPIGITIPFKHNATISKRHE